MTTSTCTSPQHQEWDCPRHYAWRKQFTRTKWCEPCRIKTIDAAGRGYYADKRKKVNA